jgi:hypothetical protein
MSSCSHLLFSNPQISHNSKWLNQQHVIIFYRRVVFAFAFSMRTKAPEDPLQMAATDFSNMPGVSGSFVASSTLSLQWTSMRPSSRSTGVQARPHCHDCRPDKPARSGLASLTSPPALPSTSSSRLTCPPAFTCWSASLFRCWGLQHCQWLGASMALPMWAQKPVT